MATETADRKADQPRRGRFRRRLAWLALGVVVLLILLVILAPTIAAPIARPALEDAVNQQIRGNAEVRSLGLSWLGAQRASVTLDDPDGGRVADVSVRAERGLLALALGSRRLGMVYVEGGATIVRDETGRTNLERAIEPRFPKPAAPPEPGKEPARLPASLGATVVLDGVEVIYQDAALAQQTGGALAAVRLGSLRGSLDFAVGSPLRVEIAGPISTGRSAADLAESGSISLEASVTNLTDASGTLTPDQAEATLALDLAAPALDAVVRAAFADRTLTTTGETRITVSAAEMASMVPKVSEALRAQPGVEIVQLPALTIAVDSLRLPVGGDLRGGAAAARLETTAIGGTIELPAGEQARPSPFTIEPLAIVLDAPSLAETVTLKGGTRARIGEQSAGELSLDLAVSGILDETGAVRASMPAQVAGGLRVDGFSTQILQPFVSAINTAMPEGVRLDLPADLGPTVDATLAARSRPDTPGAYDIDLTLDAERAAVVAAVAIADNGQRISSREGGVKARLSSLAPLADRFLAPHGVRVQRGAAVDLEAAQFAIDLGKLAGPEGPDLRGASASASLAITGAGGTVQLTGHESPMGYTLERLALGLTTADASGEVRITGDASAKMLGNPLATMRSDLTLSGLLDGSGAPRTDGLPTLRGEARLEAVRTETLDKVLSPWLASTGLVLAQELGERVDAVLLAASNPGAGAQATDLDLTLRSRNVDITAPLTVTPDRVRSRDPVMLAARTAGATLARFMEGKGPLSFESGGAARVALAEVDVPLEPGFKVRPDRARASVTATLDNFAALIDLAQAEPGAQGAAPAAPSRIGIHKVVTSVTAVPGRPPALSLDGRLGHQGNPFTIAASATLHELFRPEPLTPDDPMSVLDIAGMRPESRLTVTDAPAVLAGILPRGTVSVGDKPLDLVLIARESLGRTANLEITTSPAPNDPRVIRAGATIQSEGLQTTLDARLDPASHLTVAQLSATARVTPRVASHLSETLAPDAPVKPGLASPASISLALTKPLAIAIKDGAPDLAGSTGALDARATLDAALAAITLPAADGAEPMTIPPVTVRGLTVALAAPLASLGEKGGEASATITGALLAADGSGLADLSGGLKAPLKSGKPSGAMPTTVTIGNIAGAWLDALLEKPSLVSGALGDRFSISLAADPDRLARKDASAPALTMEVKAPRLESSTPIALTVGEQAISLSEPVALTWVMGPRWANLYAFGSPPGGPPPAFSLTEQTRVRLSLPRLAVATGEGMGPLKPGVFNVDVAATLPDLAGKLSDGRAVRVGDLALKLGRGPTPEQLGFSIAVPRMKIGDQPEVTPRKSQITGSIASFADAAGNPRFEGAVLNLEGGIAPIPTDIIDALARQNGLLRDALGPTLDFTIDADNFSMTGGMLHAAAVTPLARADITGRVKEGLFIIDPSKSTIEVTQITRELTQRFQKAVPVVASLEKTRADEPAKVTFHTPIALPLDGNLDRLNGELTFDIGTARFGTADLFQRVLAVAQQKTAGEVGRRLPPLHVTMSDGLVSYDPFAVPFGEFTLETKGFINLGSRPRQIREGSPGDAKNQLAPGRLEVITLVPSGAFVAEAVPGLKELPIPIVGQLARLPIRTSGPIAEPKNDVALELVGQNAVNELVNPGKILDEGGRNLLRDLLRGGGRD